MAQSFVAEIGDRLGGDGVENTVGEHVKILSPKYYQRTDNGVVSNPSLQTALDGKAASDHTHTLSITPVTPPSGTHIYDIYPGSTYQVTAGGNSNHIRVVEPTESYSSTIKYWEPNGNGQFQGQHKYCPESRTLYEWVVDRWIPLNNTHHRLIVQIKYLKINPSESTLYPRNVVCDKTDFTGSGMSTVFKPVDPYMMAWWYNRGDSFELGREVSTDPWGDGYPTWITEFQFGKDSGDDRYYCTNMNSVRYDSTTGNLISKWCNYITDYSTGSAVKYLEFQQW